MPKLVLVAVLLAVTIPSAWTQDTSGCSLCGEGVSLPDAVKNKTHHYQCKKADGTLVEGFEGSSAEECEAAGGSHFYSRTCGDMEEWLRTLLPSTSESCHQQQENYKLRCSCPGTSGCSLCGEGVSLPDAERSRTAGYECNKADGSEVKGFEGSSAEECEAAGGSYLKSYTCGDLETYLYSALTPLHERCSDLHNYYVLRCSCPLVLKVPEADFTKFIDGHEQLLVLFCTTWAVGCEKLSKMFSDAASILNDVRPNVRLAQIDGDGNPRALERFNVRGFPTLKWFKDGKSTEYTGGLQASEVVAWVDMIVDMQGGHRHTPRAHRHLSPITR